MSTSAPERAPALDALRGLAILGMMLSGVVPWNGLPAWMYHAQTPPPARAFDPKVPGITWVDLVFPFFLFAMGAAIPLAFRESRSQGENIRLLLTRFALLVAFAVIGQHLRPYTISASPSNEVWLLGLLGFGLMLLAFGRLPVPQAVGIGLRALGWGGLVLLLANLRYPDGSGFALTRFDIILTVLANMALFAGALWLLLRARREWLFVAMAVVFAALLAKTVPGGLLNRFWNWAPQPWLFSPDYLPYLLVLIPGLLLGRRLRQGAPNPTAPVALLAAAFVPLMLVLFFSRWEPLLALPLGLALLGAARRADEATRELVAFGLLWLLLGALLEPYEGGIKKDPKTLSYLLATSGLAQLSLVALAALPRRALGWVTPVGQNPMLAYVAITNLVAPVWALTIGGWVAEHTQGPWPGFFRACLQTALLALAVALFTRLRVFMRA